AELFEFMTLMDNSHFCKPNPGYYEEILDRLGLAPEECLMVGNDVQEDMSAENLGIKVFLMTDDLINRTGEDVSHIPQGDFTELFEYLNID
ncbi:MAG: HAD-IA family hydrolase, partial [Firmicutes bacterium]|nr:HAD-IA family hydrolase [Bacillota bacterium]